MSTSAARRVRVALVLGRLLTGLAAVLVLAALTVPGRLEALHPVTFVRLPLEALVYLVIVVALPARLGRLLTVLALACGTVLGLAAVLKVLDLGFLQSLNRRFDVLVDWRYTRPLIHLVQDSFGDGFGTALLAGVGVIVVALLLLVPLAVLRLTREATRHRAGVVRALAVLAPLWLILALLDVRGSGGDPLAARDTGRYVYGQVSRIPADLRDQREFTQAARRDPARSADADQLLTGLRGKDVLFVFVESYGRVALESPSISSGVDAVLDAGDRDLTEAGFTSRSAWVTSPTFGAISWLAHATLQSGLWVNSQRRYDTLVKSPRLTLSKLFGRAGWRTVDVVPANTHDWPQGVFFGYDHIYDSRNVGYRGPRFGYPTMPDQYTLDAFGRHELAPHARRPVMAEIDLISSHAPWSRTPRMIDQAAVGDGSVYAGMPEQLPSEKDIWPSAQRVKAAYGKSIEYSLTALFEFLRTYGDENLVVVFLGDHQPATIVSGVGASYDVPISIVAKDPAVLGAIDGWDWQHGLRPGPGAPIWRMDAFRDRFLAAYGSGTTTQAHSADGH